MSLTLDAFHRAKAIIEACPKPLYQASVVNHSMYRLLLEQIPPAKPEAFSVMGMRIYPLIGLQDDCCLMFEKDEHACEFIDKVEAWVRLGIPPEKACKLMLEIHKTAQELRGMRESAPPACEEENGGNNA